MNGTDIVASSSITTVWMALGGDSPTRFGRARAFYRDGDNQQAVALNETKGCWYDHRDHVGGGVLDLIQRVLGCGRGSALRWLADLNGIPLDDRPLSRSERRQYGRRLAQAEQLARDVADFEHGLELVLQHRRDCLGALTECFLRLGADPGDLLVGAVRDIATLRSADPDSLVAAYRQLPESLRARFRDKGRRDREEAERVTHAIVEVLARTNFEVAA